MSPLLAVLAAAAALRLTGLGYGLPAVYNADEPHLVNVAVSLGAGTLNPGAFKYPSLAIYALAALYGLYFVAWSGLGLRAGARRFAEGFARDPGPFYLLGRALSAGASLAALWPARAAAADWWGPRAGLYAAALLAVSPTLVVAAHAVKPESLMLLWSAWAWLEAARYLERGEAPGLLRCGALCGLAASTAYTAAPLAALVPAAWAARRLAAGKAPGLWAAAAAVPAAFLAGTPYAAFDFRSFAAWIGDMGALQAIPLDGRPGWARVLPNIPGFCGPWPFGAALLAAGAARLWRTGRPRLLLAAAPVLSAAAFFSLQQDGGWPRYLMSVYPGLALVAAGGADWAAERLGRPWAGNAVLAALLLPGGLQSAAYARGLLLPDTRALAAEWIEARVPSGTIILADQEHACPRLRLSLEAAERIRKRLEGLGHPKRRYYELLVSGHPGGGYDVLRLRRGAADLRAGPRHVQLSAQGQETLDASPGLDAVLRAGAAYAVTSSHGATPERAPELARFFRELESRAELAAEFAPDEGRVAGPLLRIYRLPAAAWRGPAGPATLPRR